MDKRLEQVMTTITDDNAYNEKPVLPGNEDNRSWSIRVRSAFESTKLLMEATPMACHLWNQKLEMFECNEENVRLFNLSNREELLANHMAFLPEFQPDGELSTDMAYRRLRQAFRDGRCVFECILRTWDDLPIPAEVTLVRVAYKDEIVVVGYIRDLREHRRIMEEMREAHRRASLLLNSTPMGASLWDRETNIFDCNEEAVKLFGLSSKEEYIARFFELSPEYQPNGDLSSEKAKENIRETFTDGKRIFEWMHVLPDGTPLPAEIVLVRVPYEDDFVVAGYCRDLREEKAIMYEIDRRDYLLDTVNHAASILLQSGMDDFATNLHRCMGMFAEAVGVDRISIHRNQEIDNELSYSQVFEWFEGVGVEKICAADGDCPENPTMFYNVTVPSWVDVLARGDCINRLVQDMPDMERFFFLFHGVLAVFVTPVFLRDKFWGFVSYDNYHEKRVFSEDEQMVMRSGGLVIANALLQNDMMQNLHSTAGQLEIALEEAQAANEAKSEFLAKMSHEMRTPLTAIIGLSELSLEKDGLEWEIYSNLEKVNNAGVTLLNTVNDILDISKIEAGMMELVPVDYHVSSLINDTVIQNIMRIGEKPIKLILDMKEDMFARLHGDELRVKQIMNNLLSNAIKYTQEGEVELGTRCEREGDTVWLTITVRDTGSGIKTADLEKLYINFAQMDISNNRLVEGTGLGLPITKKLAEMMQGTIDVSSEYGKGSIFTVRVAQKFVTNERLTPEVLKNLKSFRYSDHKRSYSRQIERIRLPYARVLVVDDNMANLDVIKGLMKPYEMQIDCLTDGRQAVDAIAAEKVKYNAVFMDHMMPYMDGIKATQVIREMDSDYARNIPIIAITANAIAGNEELFLSKGFQAFLTKPIDISHLDEAIRRWVRDEEQDECVEQCRSAKEGKIQPQLYNMIDRRAQTDRRSGIDRRKANIKFAGLDIGKGVSRFGGDVDTYMDILRSFTVNTPPLLQSLADVDRDTLTDYAITIHGIKGASRGIFADMLGTSAEILEKAAKAGDYSYIIIHNPQFLDLAWRLIHDLEDMFATIDTQNPKPQKDKPEAATLARILTACADYDIDSVEEEMAELEKYQYSGDDGLVAWLKENVKRTNFKEIKETLTSMIEEER